MKAIVNANIIVNNYILRGYGVLFEETIARIVRDCDINKAAMEEVVDGRNKYLSAGFIDIHMHGCLGYDTMDEDGRSIAEISKGITSTGITSFLPTTMTMDLPAIERTLSRIKKLMSNEPGASILGCNLEGPFISAAYKGAHDEKYILEPDFAYIERFTDIIRIVTVAPEKEGSGEFIERCERNGIKAAIGHTGANYEEAVRAIHNGANHITHIFNAMTPLHHREPGVAAAAMDSQATCELIADNIHVAPAVQRILLKVKGIDKIILVTDAMKACLLGDGEYELGGQKVIVKGEEARLPAGKLAGSVITLNKALKNFMKNTGVCISDAVKTVTENPARLLKIDGRKGSITPGKDADFTLFDEDFNIYATFVKGKKVYERQA